ncbi:MAG: hypothetical protein V4642_09205 [Bacteroidota bacterium]
MIFYDYKNVPIMASFRLARNLRIMQKGTLQKDYCLIANCHFTTPYADEEDSGQAGMTM